MSKNEIYGVTLPYLTLHSYIQRGSLHSHLAPHLQRLSRVTQSWLPRKGQPPSPSTAEGVEGVVHHAQRGGAAASKLNASPLPI